MKRIISAIIAISIIASTALFSANAQTLERARYGDANHDHRINMQDVVSIQKHLAKLNDCLFCMACANVDGDELTLKDVTSIQKHLAGFKTDSQCGQDTIKYCRLTSISIDNTLKTSIENAYIKYNPLSDERINEIKADYGELVDVDCYGALCDGAMMVIAQYNGYGFTGSIEEMEINGYIYTHTDGKNEMHLYKDGKYVSMKEALEKNMITEAAFKELVFHLHMKQK